MLLRNTFSSKKQTPQARPAGPGSRSRRSGKGQAALLCGALWRPLSVTVTVCGGFSPACALGGVRTLVRGKGSLRQTHVWCFRGTLGK